MQKVTVQNEPHVNSFITPLTEAFMAKRPVDHKITKEDAQLIIDNAVMMANAVIAAGATPGTDE